MFSGHTGEATNAGSPHGPRHRAACKAFPVSFAVAPILLQGMIMKNVGFQYTLEYKPFLAFISRGRRNLPDRLAQAKTD
jgi:hypothetical protein